MLRVRATRHNSTLLRPPRSRSRRPRRLGAGTLGVLEEWHNRRLALLILLATALHVLDGPPDWHDVPTTDNKQRPCRVIVENKVDYHHEVIESTVLRFPLPWHEFNCTTSKPVVYDFALYQNRFLNTAKWREAMEPMKPGAATTALSRKAKHLNETEFWGWKKYFESDLQHKVFGRNDGSDIPTEAYFNDLISYRAISESESPIDAVIDVSCMNGKFLPWLKEQENRYCVLHGSNKNTLPRWPRAYNKSCFLSPMWPENQCKFVAADLPKFNKNDENPKGIKICVQGGSRNTTLAAEMFSKIPYQQYNATLHVSGRSSYEREVRSKFDLGSRVTFSSEPDFVSYFRMVSRCDIVLPLTDPSNRPSHYPWGDKQSSGIIPSLVAYKLPAVMHKEYAKIYGHELTAPWEEYDDTMDSKVVALKKMLVQVHEEKTKASQEVWARL